MQESSDSESDDEHAYAVNSGHSCPKVNIKVGGCQFKTTIDTGASVNVMDQSTFAKLNNVQLSKAKIKAFLYDSREPVEFIGKFDATVETKQRITVATFYVTKTASSGNLLSSDTLQELNLISLHLNKLAVTNNVKDANLKEILDQHAEVFEGLGNLKGQTVHLNIDKEVTPRAQPQRRILYHIRENVRDALNELESSDVIERVPENEGTPWVSPIIAVPKKDVGIRICVNMRQASEAITRIRHPISTVDDKSFKLNSAIHFLKLDLSQAYHQLELDESSRYITTFLMNFGIND